MQRGNKQLFDLMFCLLLPGGQHKCLTREKSESQVRRHAKRYREGYLSDNRNALQTRL